MQATFIALTGILAIVQANPISIDRPKLLTKRDVIGNLPESADGIEIDFQPLVDFDSDGCYQTSAIDASKKVGYILKIKGLVCSNRSPEIVFRRTPATAPQALLKETAATSVSLIALTPTRASAVITGIAPSCMNIISRKISQWAAASPAAIATTGRTLSSLLEATTLFAWPPRATESMAKPEIVASAGMTGTL